MGDIFMFNINSKTMFIKRASKLCVFVFLLLFVFLISGLFVPKVAFASEQSVLDKIKANNCPCYQGDGDEGLKEWKDLYPTRNWPYAEKLFVTEDKKNSVFSHDWSSVTCYGLINECSADNWADH